MACGSCWSCAMLCLVFLAAAVLGEVACAKSTDSTPVPASYTGPFSGQLIVITTTTGNRTNTCSSTRALGYLENATDKVLRRVSNRNSGDNRHRIGDSLHGVELVHSVTRRRQRAVQLQRPGHRDGGKYRIQHPGLCDNTSVVNGSTATVTSTNTLTFSGTLSGGVVSGTMQHSEGTEGSSTGVNGSSGSTISGSGTTSIPVTLR
jgi:hypothetical protein